MNVERWNIDTRQFYNYYQYNKNNCHCQIVNVNKIYCELQGLHV